MCGRFALGIPKKRLEEVFEVALPDTYGARYNIAPGSDVLAIDAPEGAARSCFLRWGLIPHFAKDASVGFSMTNARAETVFEKVAFKDSIRLNRCLIPAQVFYEWKDVDGHKQPFAISLEDTDVFAMAGFSANWEDWTTGKRIDSFTILTCEPNGLMRTIHHRMPVILPQEAWSDWLNPELQDPDALVNFLVPYPEYEMVAHPVSTAVNKTANDSPDLLERVDVMRQGRLF